MSAVLTGLTASELFWLATHISRAEGHACGRYVEGGDSRQREMFEELLLVRLDAEDAYLRTAIPVSARAQAQAHASRASALMAVRLRSAPTPAPAIGDDGFQSGDNR